MGVFGRTESSSHFVGGAWREGMWIFFAGQSPHWKITLVMGVFFAGRDPHWNIVTCSVALVSTSSSHITALDLSQNKPSTKTRTTPTERVQSFEKKLTEKKIVKKIFFEKKIRKIY